MHRTHHMLIAAFAAGLLAATLAPADEGNLRKEIDALRADKTRIEKTERPEFYRRIREIRDRLAQHSDMAEARRAVDEALQAYERKVAEDKDIGKARQRRDAAERDYERTLAEEVARSEQGGKLRARRMELAEQR